MNGRTICKLFNAVPLPNRNLCFISGKTNRQISDKPPAQYFTLLIEKFGRMGQASI